MNKVISVEIAKQVFWIDQDAYTTLKNYFDNIRKQLENDECANEIYQDIELRIAELLFEFSPSDKQAITSQQLDSVIDQVGFINDDNLSGSEPETNTDKTNRKSYLDTNNKIVAGVCAGLSIRFRVPAFILRTLFLGLALFFGLGLMLYLVFWISLEKNSNRNTALAAEGKARTAKQLATAELPKDSPALQIQRILFLPFSIIGTLLFVIGDHFRVRKPIYMAIFKNLIALAFVGFAVLAFAALLNFTSNGYLHGFVNWVLGFAVVYLIVLAIVVYFKEFYLPKPRTKLDIRLKYGALVPIVIIGLSIYSFDKMMSEQAVDEANQVISLNSNDLTIRFEENHDHTLTYAPVHYRIQASDSISDTAILKITYLSWGKNKEQARENLNSIDYSYRFTDNELVLNNDWLLKEDTYFRNQRVAVTIVLPSNLSISSNLPLVVDEYEDEIIYRLGYKREQTNFDYISKQAYLHEVGEQYPNKLSNNERTLLQAEFCKAFFIGHSWGCSSNIVSELKYNHRFDNAFSEDIDKIAKIQSFLQADRSIFVSNLDDIMQLFSELSVTFTVKSDFQKYVEHLQVVKAEHVIEMTAQTQG